MQCSAAEAAKEALSEARGADYPLQGVYFQVLVIYLRQRLTPSVMQQSGNWPHRERNMKMNGQSRMNWLQSHEAQGCRAHCPPRLLGFVHREHCLQCRATLLRRHGCRNPAPRHARLDRRPHERRVCKHERSVKTDHRSQAWQVACVITTAFGPFRGKELLHAGRVFLGIHAPRQRSARASRRVGRLADPPATVCCQLVAIVCNRLEIHLQPPLGSPDLEVRVLWTALISHISPKRKEKWVKRERKVRKIQPKVSQNHTWL